MSKIDLTGQRFGRLIALKDVGSGYGRSRVWLCLCDCGNKKNVASRYLKGGATKSCGCLIKETKAIFFNKTPNPKYCINGKFSKEKYLRVLRKSERWKKYQKEYFKEYYKKNSERVLAYGKEYREKNPGYFENYNKSRSKEEKKRHREQARKRSVVLTKTLDSQYIERLLIQKHGINRNDVTKEMIEERRCLLIFKRELKKTKELANEFYRDQP